MDSARCLNTHIYYLLQSRRSRGDGTAVLAPPSQNTCDHNSPLAGSDPSDLSEGIAESIVAPNGGFLARGLRLIVDLSTQVNAISITRPFYRSL